MPSSASDRKSVLSNSVWGIAQQVVATGTSAIFSILIVVAISVEDYGIYSYSTSLAALGQTVMSAGLSGLAVKAIVQAGDKSRNLVGSLLLIRELFAFLAFIFMTAVAFTSGDQTVILTVIVAAAALFGRALDVTEFWYQAHQRFSVPSRIRIAVSMGLFIVRLAAVMFFPKLWLFILLFALEGILAGIFICVAYLMDPRSDGIGRPVARTSRRLLRDSIPLFISGIASQINLRSDVIFIQIFYGVASVGVYSAAARLSELTFMIPVVIMNTVFPILLRRRAESHENGRPYARLIQRSYDVAFWGGVGCALATGVVGTLIIRWIFGAEYEGAILLLWIQVIAMPFIYMAAVFSKWIIAEHLLWASTMRHVAGAILNIVLNIMLLPVMGLVGSAVATVVSYVMASYFSCYLSRSTRPAAGAMNKAMLAPVRYIVGRSGRRKV